MKNVADLTQEELDQLTICFGCALKRDNMVNGFCAECIQTQKEDAEERLINKRTYDWLHANIPISMPEFSDNTIASRIRMLSRTDLDHEPMVCAARDRIMCLVKEKAQLQNDNKIYLEKIDQLNQHLEHRDCRIKAQGQIQESDEKEIAGLQKAIAIHCRENIGELDFTCDDHAIRYFVSINGDYPNKAICAACKGRGSFGNTVHTFRECTHCKGKG